MNNEVSYSELEQRYQDALKRIEDLENQYESENIVDTDILHLQKVITDLNIHQEELRAQNDELRGMRNQLEESQKQYSDLFMNAPVGYVVLTEEGVIKDANHKASELFSLKRDFLIRRPLMRFVLKDEHNNLMKFFKDLRESMNPIEMETQFITRGQIIWNGFVSGSVQLDANEEIDHIRLTLRDISYRKKLETDLQTMVQKQQSLIDNLPGATYHIKITGSIEYIEISSMAEEYFGVNANVLTKNINSWYDFIHPSDRDYVQKAKQRFFKQGERQALDYRIIDKDGDIRWLQDLSKKLETSEGILIQGFLSEISDRKEAEFEQERSKERFHKLVEHSPVPIFVHSGFTFSYINPAAVLALRGNTKSDFMEKPVMDIIPKHSSEKVKKLIQNVYDKQSDVIGREQKLLCIDGSEIDVILSGSSVDYKGKPASMVVFHNISEIRKTQKALVESETLLNTTFNALEDLIVVVDQDMKIVLSNYQPNKMSNSVPVKNRTHCFACFFNSDKICDGCIAPEVFKYGEIRSTEMVNPEDGRIRDVKVIPVIDENGEVTKVIEQIRDITDKRKNEQTQKERHLFLAKITEAIPSIIFIQDIQENRNVYINDEFHKVLGYTKHDIDEAGRDFYSQLFIFPNEELDGMLQKYHNFKDDEIIEGEYKVRHKDGSFRYLYTRVIIFDRDSEGKPKRILGLATDHTERKRTEAELIRFRIALDSSYDQIYLINSETLRIIEVNTTAISELEYLEDEFYEMTFDELLPDQNFEKVKESFELVKENEMNSYSFKTEFESKMGERIPVKLYYTTVDSSDSTVFLATVKNLTDEEKTLAALQKSEERFLKAMEAVNEGLWDWDLKTDKVYYSPNYFQMLGYSKEEFANDVSTWQELIHPEDRENIINNAKKLINDSTKKYELEFRMQAADGSYVWILSRGKAVEFDEDKKPLRMIGTHIDITDRKEMENEIREIKQYNEQILNSAGEGIFGIDTKGIITFSNPSAANILGYHNFELIGQHHHELIQHTKYDGREYRYEKSPIYASLTEGKTVMKDDEIFWRKDNSAVRVEYNSVPMISEGVIEGVVVTFNDITERKKIEQELKNHRMHLEELVNQKTIALKKMNNQLVEEIAEKEEVAELLKNNEQRMRLINDSLPLMIAEIDNNLRYRYVNSFYRDVMNLAESEIIGHYVKEVTGSLYPSIEKRLQDTLNGVPSVFEITLGGEPNTQRNLYVRYLPNKSIDAAATSIILLAEDITERKKIQEALKQSEERLTLALTAADEGLYDWDIPNDKLYLSPRWYTMLGYEYKELEMAFKTWETLVHPDDISMAMQELEKVLQAKKSDYRIELRMKTKSGKWKWILTRGKVAARNNKGEPTRMVGTHQDIDDLKELQNKLINSERLATLGLFSGSLSHEIRNPLGTIGGSAYIIKTKLMKTKNADKSYWTHIGRINAAVNRANDVIDSLLNLTQMKEPKVDVLNLAQFTDNVIDEIKVPEAIRIHKTYPDKQISIMADPVQLLLAVKNIIKNGFQAMDERGDFYITLENDADFAKIICKDTGSGITEEHIENIFDPLYTTKTKGIGFGLTIAKLVVERHNGKLTVESAPNEGATFTVFLPFENPRKAASHE